MADDYDGRFTRTAIGTLMRKAVWQRCAARFAGGTRVLEMNCGTGEDALWLAQRGVHVFATDVSAAMLHVARKKLADSAAGSYVGFHRLAWEELDSLEEGPFDGVLSNFGGLNCVGDLRAAALALAKKIKSGGTAILCIMGPVVPWEWAWFLAHGDPRRAFRRLRRGGASWSGIPIHYPSCAKALRSFAPEFRALRVSAIGALLPPPYTEKRLGRYPRIVAALDRVERRCESLWPLPMLADHYLLELERV